MLADASLGPLHASRSTEDQSYPVKLTEADGLELYNYLAGLEQPFSVVLLSREFRIVCADKHGLLERVLKRRSSVSMADGLFIIRDAERRTRLRIDGDRLIWVKLPTSRPTSW